MPVMTSGGAILLEEVDGKRFYCGHASGQFKESEKHYHATYKEILAVKRGIEKFSFYLNNDEFTVEMDNTSFPRMLNPKGKVLPDAQILRWKDWFSRYKFSVHHVKGHHNIVADYLSRPQRFPLPEKPSSKATIYILTISENPEPIMPFTAPCTIFPPGYRPESSVDLTNKARSSMFYWLHKVFIQTRITARQKHFDMDIPYTTIPLIKGPICEELLWYIWSLSILHFCAIGFPVYPIYQYLCNENNLETHLAKLFLMFAPIHFWRGQLNNIVMEEHLAFSPPERKQSFYAFFILHREEGTFQAVSTNNVVRIPVQFTTQNHVELWGTSPSWPTHERRIMTLLGKALSHRNELDDIVYRGLPLGPFSSFPSMAEVTTASSSEITEFQSNFIMSGLNPMNPTQDPIGAQDPNELDTQFQQQFLSQQNEDPENPPLAQREPNTVSSPEQEVPDLGESEHGGYPSNWSEDYMNLGSDHEPIHQSLR